MTLGAEVQTLRKVPMFREVDPSRLKLLAFTSERISFRDGQRFFSQSDAADAAYVILEGQAAVVIGTGDSQLEVAKLGQNDLVGEMAILSGTPRSATVVARSDVSALRIDKSVFLELLTQFPQISIAVMRELASRLERTNAQLVARSSAGR